MKNSPKSMVFVFLLGLVLFASLEAQERKMYSWTDEDGTVHYTDVKPDGQQYQEQAIPQDAQAPADDPYASTATQSGTSVAEQRRQDIAQKRQEQAATQAATEMECAAWQAEVERLEPNRRVFYTNDQGETVRMDDQVRVDRVAGLKAQIARKCK